LSGGSRPTKLNVERLPAVEDVPLPTKVVDAPPPDPSGASVEAVTPPDGDLDGAVTTNGQLPNPPAEPLQPEAAEDPST